MGLNSTLQGDGWHVDPITSPPVLAHVDPVTGGIKVSCGGRDIVVGTAGPGSIFKKYGATAFDVTRSEGSAGFAVTATNTTNTISSERTRFGSYSRRVVIGTSPADIKFRATGAGSPLNIHADQTDKAFSVALYFEDIPNEFLSPNNPYMTVNLSNLWSGGSNQSRWTFDTGYLRQGWNIITLRAADVVSGVSGDGDAPRGQTRNSDLGTGFDWTGSLEFISFSFVNFPVGSVVHIDQVRKAPLARSILVVGFDAVGAFGNDEVMYTSVAPLFRTYGVKSYVTMTYIYDLLNAGGAGWSRFVKLQNEYGWDAIPHTWNHGGTSLGGNWTLASLVAASDVVTAQFTSAHQIPLGRHFRAKISGASIAAANGVFEMTATTTNQVTYTATGAGTGTATGTIKINTFLSEVFATDTAENRRMVAQEVTRNAEAMRANGFGRGVSYLAYPNNSVPHIDVMYAAASAGGVKFGRASRGGYAMLDECGLDNPLNFGSFNLDNGDATTCRTSYVAGKIKGAIARGVHVHLYGHFVLNDEDPANSAYAPTNPDYAPGQGGNPAPPAGASESGAGWWYLSQLRDLLTNTVGPAVAAGDLVVMSPSEYAAYMGQAVIF